MIYLDSAATSLLKPSSVAAAMSAAVKGCASPGRGAYAAAARAADIALACREEAAAFFHVNEPERVVFTMNATHGLNIAIRSLVRPGMRVLISGYEHNAVTRPLRAMGAKVLVAAAAPFDRCGMLAAFRRLLPQAELVVCTHVSNVFGFILPIEEIAAMCRAAAVPLIVDAAQSAGVLPLDFESLGCAFLACPGHKGLMGPQGTGLLLCRGEAKPLLIGGTGSASAEETMPDFYPDRLEAGTQNIPGVAGLLEGLRWVKAAGTDEISRLERHMSDIFATTLAGVPGLRVFHADDPALQSGVLSVQHAVLDAESAAEKLGERGIAVRAGLHCAPLAHKTAGTLERGTLRFSFSPLLKPASVREAAAVAAEIFMAAVS